jgi:hypothetical protein
MPKRLVGAAGGAAAAAGGCWKLSAEDLGCCSSGSDPAGPSPAGDVAGEAVWDLGEATAGNPGGGPIVEGLRTGVGGVPVEEK